MSYLSLSQTYRIAPRGDAARAPAPEALLTPRADRDGHRGRDHARGGGAHEDSHDCDSVRRSPLLRALMRALQVPMVGVQDVVLERALIAFARALNHATGDAETTPSPAAARAADTAQRRARNEEQLLVAFAELQHAAGRPAAATHEALQVQLGAFLHALARELHVDDDRAGAATQPGSLISVHA
ncbi:MAG TPA: hypothetical protein VFK10_18265 [Burkholderiaceae bacterium]|nr:hypothetical protein [Burkholderiaceae bacterium]